MRLRTNEMKTTSKRIRGGFTIALVATCFTALAIAATAAANPTLKLGILTCEGLVNPQGLESSDLES